jgi:hypothetical protein
MKLMEIISMDFDATDQLLIKYSALIIHWKGFGSIMAQ